MPALRTSTPALLGLLLAGALLAGSPARAQDPMLFRFDGFPGAPLSDPLPDGEATATPDIALYAISIGGVFPITRGGTRLLGGLRYENLRVDLLENDGLLLFTLEHLHLVRADLLLYQRLAERWTLGLFVQPSLASDLKQIDGDDVKLQATALLLRRASDRLGYGFGAAYRNDFGEPSLVPLLKVDYGDEAGLRIAALLPVNAYVGYAFGPDREVGLAARVTGMQYNINVDEYTLLAPDAPADTDLPAEYSVLTVGPSVRQRVVGPLFVVAEAGATLWRRFEFDGDRINTTLDQDGSLYARFGIAYRSGTPTY